MTDSKVPEKLLIPVGGRSMWVKRPTGAQATLIHRHGVISSTAAGRYEALEDTPDNEDRRGELGGKAIGGIAEILDILERLIMDPEDREFLQERMKNGDLDLVDMYAIPDAFLAADKKVKKVAKAKLVQ